jgi:hypothetical protein
MSNLIKRWRIPSYDDGNPIFLDPTGDFVKFDDVKDLRSSTDVQQLKAEIAALANKLDIDFIDYHKTIKYVINKLRQLSAV